MQADTTTTLAPCPFCGAEPTTKTRSKSPEDGGGYVSFVACYCGGYSANAHQHGDGETAPEAQAAAEIAWNRRAPVPASDALKTAAQALIDRWDTPLWKNTKHTGLYIDELREALAAPPAQEVRESCTLISRIAELAEQHGSLRAAARSLDFDPGYLARLQSGEKCNPSPALLERLGLRQVITYERGTT